MNTTPRTCRDCRNQIGPKVCRCRACGGMAERVNVCADCGQQCSERSLRCHRCAPMAVQRAKGKPTLRGLARDYRAQEHVVKGLLDRHGWDGARAILSARLDAMRAARSEAA